MAKEPPDLPEVNDRVKLRGRDAVGILRQINARNWARIEWDVPGSAPRICHLYELEKEASHGPAL